MIRSSRNNEINKVSLTIFNKILEYYKKVSKIDSERERRINILRSTIFTNLTTSFEKFKRKFKI